MALWRAKPAPAPVDPVAALMALTAAGLEQHATNQARS